MAEQTINLYVEDVSGSPITQAQGTAHAVLDQLEDYLTAEWQGGAFTLRLDVALGEDERARITSAVQSAVRDLCEWDWIDGGGSGWDGPRVTVDDSLEPAFVGQEDGAEDISVGLWVDGNTFMCASVGPGMDTRPPLVQQWVYLAHWHPDSMTSGSWHGELGVLPGGVLVAHSYKDEDGDYYQLSQAPSDPDAVASEIKTFVEQNYLFGAEFYLMPLYALAFPDDSNVCPFQVGLLPGTDNEGYEISSFGLGPPPAAVEPLRKLGALGDAQRRQLLEAIVAYTGYEYGVPLEHLPAGWRTVVARLQDTADA